MRFIGFIGVFCENHTCSIVEQMMCNYCDENIQEESFMRTT